MKRLAVMAIAMLARGVCAAPSISVGIAAGAPGETAMVPVNYVSDTNIVSLQFDLVYATNVLASGNPVGGSALADHVFGTSEITSGLRRVLIFSFSNTPFTNGVLVYIPFTIATNAIDHDEVFSLTNVLFVSANADPIPPAAILGGRLAVSPSPRLSPSAVTGDGVAHVQLAGTSGRTYVIEASATLEAPQWAAVATNTATGGPLNFDDASAGNISPRFYRARLEP
jgi:hypothetical protein